MGLLLILGTSPVYVHHLFALGDAQLLAGIDHLGAICLTALHLLLQPVHRVFHVIILVGITYAAWDRVRAWRVLRRTLVLLEQRAPAVGDAFWHACSDAGVDPHMVRVVEGLPNPAFTVGLVVPRIYLAEDLGRRLSAQQLRALIKHEAAHVRRHDPLRLFLLRLLACTLFWIPALRRLEEDVHDEAELLADDVAADGKPLVLASTILTLADWYGARKPPGLSVGFQRDDLLERRIRRLAGEQMPGRSHVTRKSIVGAALALGLVWSSGVLMAHPLPNGTHATGTPHCEHEGRFALGHLFCLGSPFAHSRHDECPHGAQ
jgi:hypothetical protein